MATKTIMQSPHFLITFKDRCKVDFNDGVNLAIMERQWIKEIYTNDKKHLGSVKWLNTIFE